MAFELAVVAIKPAGVGTGIKASLKKIRGEQAKLSLTLTGDAFTKLAWSNGDKIVVQIGTGEHHGLIRLQKNNSTGQAEYRVKDAVGGRQVWNSGTRPPARFRRSRRDSPLVSMGAYRERHHRNRAAEMGGRNRRETDAAAGRTFARADVSASGQQSHFRVDGRSRTGPLGA